MNGSGASAHRVCLASGARDAVGLLPPRETVHAHQSHRNCNGEQWLRHGSCRACWLHRISPINEAGARCDQYGRCRRSLGVAVPESRQGLQLALNRLLLLGIKALVEQLGQLVRMRRRAVGPGLRDEGLYGSFSDELFQR